MSTLKAMFFVKNVPPAERVIRLVLSLSVSVWGVMVGGVLGTALLLGGAGFALTGLFGFCPMCALAGRKLKAKD